MSQYLELSTAPAWELISDVRRFVGVFCTRLCNAEVASRVALAVHEMLENSVRYSTSSQGSLRVEFSAEDGTVRIVVQNQTSTHHIERLRELVDELQARDPDEYYQECLRRNAVPREDEPGLGLSRVRAESDMVVTLDVEPASTIRLTATGQTR